MTLNLKDKKSIVPYLWFILPAIAGFLKWKANQVNNYYIYKGVFHHLVEKVNLYLPYPAEYADTNHYGPLFGYMIAPFTFIPDYIAIPLWVVFQAFVLYKALMVLPIKATYKWIALAICLVELMTSTSSVQINPTIVGMIILSWYYVKKEQVIWATLFVMLGTFIKLYGIVGLAFWVFSKDKIKYIGYIILWSLVLFGLPMLISSPEFVIQSYADWYESIVHKNELNQLGSEGWLNYQDISFMGLFKRFSGIYDFSVLLFVIPGFLLQVLPLLRFNLYSNTIFQLRYLASLLIFTVVFSTSSESPTYIIALAGVAIWFMTQDFPTKKWVWLLLAFVIILTSLIATDLFPARIRQIFTFYAIKALPCVVLWFVCIYQLFKDNFNSISTKWVIQDQQFAS
jgi:hypothetical protein